MTAGTHGIIGARSLVAHYLVARLGRSSVKLFSRQGPMCALTEVRSGEPLTSTALSRLFYLAPIWTFEQHAESIERSGVKRIVALSSMSASSKRFSADPSERILAASLIEGEEKLLAWARESGASAMIIRPTMIYDGVRDKNVATLVRFIERFGFMPVAGAGAGLRQPLHAGDLAEALVRAMQSSLSMRCDPLGGSETFSYAELVRRIFLQLGRHPRIVRLPLPMLRGFIRIARLCGLPWTEEMADRMNRDLTADDRDLRELLRLPEDHFRIVEKVEPSAFADGSI